MQTASRFVFATAIMALAAASMAQYPKKGIQFKSFIPLNQMPNNPSSGAGCTGFVSPSGREYAVVGVRNGTLIVDVTNPATPQILTSIPGVSSLWHENVVNNGFGYFVTDSDGNGMQIVDLRQADGGTANLVSTYTGNGLSTVHTIQANPASNTLYLNGSNRGLVFLDITNPTAPVEVGRWTGRYVHDSVAVTYPEGTPYAGKEIVFAQCGRNDLTILDVTDKSNPVVKGTNQYLPDGTYCHSASLTPDYKYLLVNDEFDEGDGMVADCSTHIFDVQNLSNPVYLGKFTNPINTIDHNSRLKDGFLILAAYRAGIRVYNAVNPLQMSEVGFFDTYNGSGFGYSGAWGTYVFPSGNAVISDMSNGMFMVDLTEAIGQGAVPLSLTMERGVSSGPLTALRHSDDQSLLTTDSGPQTGLGQIGVVAFETTNLPANFIDLKFEARSPKGPSRAEIQLKNWTNGQWISVGTINLGATEQVSTINGISGANYVSGTGRIEVRFRTYPTAPIIVPPFRVSWDQMKVTVRQ